MISALNFAPAAANREKISGAERRAPFPRRFPIAPAPAMLSCVFGRSKDWEPESN